MMSKNRSARTRWIVCTLLWLYSIIVATPAYAQSDKDSVTETKVPAVQTTFALIYSNNANYYGLVAEEKLPYIALSGTVRFKPGFYVNALAYRLLHDSANTISATAAGLGYEYQFSKKLKGDINYTHTFYPTSSPFLQASNPDMTGCSLEYTHWCVSTLEFDAALGKQTDYFVTLSNSKSFDFYTKDNKSIISLTPGIDIIAGTQQFYNSYTIEKERRNRGKGNGQGNPPPGQTTTVTTVSDKFGMVSYNFKLPVSYSRSKYMLEAAYQLSILGNNAATRPGQANSFITLGAYYQF